jgi:hypothetical protein
MAFSSYLSKSRRDNLTDRILHSVGVQREPSTVSRCGLGCACLAAGAAMTYFLDPAAGRRRRKMVGDKLIRAAHVLCNATDAAARDLGHRATGLFAGARSLVTSSAAPDHVLEDRIRARLGRVASHPRAIVVEVDNGCAAVGGTAPADEINDTSRRSNPPPASAASPAASKARSCRQLIRRSRVRARASPPAARSTSPRRTGPPPPACSSARPAQA